MIYSKGKISLKIRPGDQCKAEAPTVATFDQFQT